MLKLPFGLHDLLCALNYQRNTFGSFIKILFFGFFWFPFIAVVIYFMSSFCKGYEALLIIFDGFAGFIIFVGEGFSLSLLAFDLLLLFYCCFYFFLFALLDFDLLSFFGLECYLGSFRATIFSFFSTGLVSFLLSFFWIWLLLLGYFF